MKLTNLFSILLFTALITSGCESIPSHKAKLEVHSFTANLAGFSVNSHLIVGEEEAILVDAQFTRSQAKELIDQIKLSGKKLKMIYITHGHPDHYLGLEKILEAFPKAEVKARGDVIKAIKETAQGKIDYWKTFYKDDLANSYTIPSRLEDKDLFLEGSRIEIIDLGEGESAHDTALYIPSTKSLITGDTTYGKVHFWLAEERADHVLENLQKLKELDVELVYPGHGEKGGAEVIEENINYLKNFIKVSNSGESVESAKGKMLAKYPNYKLPIILDLSLKAVIK